MAASGKRQSIWFVLVTIFIDAMGYGLAGPVLPRLIMNVGDVDISAAIRFAGWMTASYAVVQFLMGPVIGNLSDRFGRRPVLLIALTGLVLNFLLLSVAQSLPVLFVAQMLGGMFGGTIGTCQAAIADMTAKEDRAHNFSLVGAAFGLGFIVGPAIGGLLGEYGERMPFIAAAVLTFVNLLYGVFVFPDTLRPENRRPFEWRRANALGAWRSMRAMPGMTAAILIVALWYIAGAVYPLTWPYYGIARFDWSNGMIGASLATVGAITALSQTVLTGRLVRRYGERGAAIIGMTGGIATFLAYAFVTQGWMAFAIMIGFVPQSMVGPALMAILANRAGADAQGEVQGMAAMAQGMGGIVAPLLINPTMAYFTSPAAPFQCAGAGFIVASVFAVAALGRLLTLPNPRRARPLDARTG
ncbi:tetracycline resistance protein [Sphingobium sp. SYK-6]|uniref:tetracycline resistance MFS efflux pump n=1 Tax=Sphingobium sp. (strain NBRC 103272 / SYK-6) TaxID=627192 RepID=UPI00022771FB|nr:tetracycline resistance MFS efflux pump [Sphingobium sp. SYK-6]BAK65883.1 tetracycline resistance protein [Sphingobium sp. SYK-6]